jgi:hypothetical protein
MAINSINGNTLLSCGSFPPVRAASTGSPLTPSTGGLLTVDGVALSAGDRVLCKDETSAVNNGIYAANTGPWVRTTDANSNQQFYSGMAVTVGLGSLNGGLTYLCTCQDDPVVVGTSLLTFAAQSVVATGTQAATSATSHSAGTTGSKSFTLTAGGSAFAVNQWVLCQETSNPANQNLGQITAVTGSPPTAITVDVVATGGSGTVADWTIVLTNSPAAAGYQPPVGSGNVTGPGSSTAGHLATFADGTGKVLADGGAPVGGANTVLPSMLALSAVQGGFNMLNGTLVATSVNSNTALEIAVKTLAGNDPSASDPVYFLFRSATPGSGAYSIIEVTAALNTTIPASSTLGFANATPGRAWIAAVNNAGTVSLAVINCLAGSLATGFSVFPLAGWGIANVTAYGGGANSAQILYGAATLASAPYSVLGYATYEVGSTLATAGTWATAPSRMELYRPGVPLPGSVVQIAGAAGTTTGSTASSTLSATVITGSIQPTSSANLVRVAAEAVFTTTINGETLLAVIRRGTTTNVSVAGNWGSPGGLYQINGVVRLSALDFPATLSSQPYTVYFASSDNSHAVTLPQTSFANPLWTITVEELIA